MFQGRNVRAYPSVGQIGDGILVGSIGLLKIVRHEVAVA